MKTFNSILFYVIVIVGIMFTLNDTINFYTFFGIGILIFEYMELKNRSKKEIFDLLGITWLQKKFKNNNVIMNITNE